MNLLSITGRTIYGVITFIAFLCALGVSFIAAWSFAIDAPADFRDPGFVLSRVALSLVLVAAITLLISVCGALSQVRLFPWLSIVGSCSLMMPLSRYTWNIAVMQLRDGERASELLGALLIALAETAVFVLSIIKVKQLRTTR